MELTKLDGLGPVTAKKLKEVGITDVLQLLTHSPREISDITGVDSDTAGRWFRNARTAYVEANENEKTMKTASEIENDRKNAKRMFIGCEPIDMMIEGFEEGSMYEFYGEFGSNKSQICFSLIARSQLPREQGGFMEDDKDVKIAFIDTEKTFRPSRIRENCERWGIDPERTLNNIYVWNVRNTVEQQIALEEIEAKIIAGENIKLMVVDSTMGLFRSEFIGRGSLSDRQGRINRFVSLVHSLSTQHKICSIVTNQVLSDPGQQFGDPTKPTGGNVVGHTSTYRIYLKKSGKNRIMRMIDSPNHPDMEVMFRVTKGGVMTVEEADKVLEEAKKILAKEKRASKKKGETLDEEKEE